MTNPIRLLVASCFAAALASPAFAVETKPAPVAKPATHAVHHAKATKAHAAAPATESDSLNAKSLSAAKAGQDFAPAASK